MSRTFLQLVQQAADELGIPQPSQVIGASDDQSRQLLALAQREGTEFSECANSRGGWQNLHKEYVFFTQVNSSTTGDITSGSPSITSIGSLSGVTAETWFVSGTGLPNNAKVAVVDSGTAVTIDRNCTATTTGVTLTFSQAAYSLPSDFQYFAQRTQWDGSYNWELLGPITAQEKGVLRYGITPAGPRRRFYVRSNKLYLDPAPSTDNEAIAFDYYSNYWCESSGGTAQARWTADTDVYKLDEQCFILGLKWRWLRAKGLDYTEEFNTYEETKQAALSRDGGNRDLPLNATQGVRFLSYENIPDTGYGE